MMRRLLFGVLLLMFVQIVSAQEEFPSLVGPIVYGQRLTSPIVFEDVGSGEVWEIDGQSVIESGFVRSWSPNGCFALFGVLGGRQYALIDLQQRTIEELDLPQMFGSGDTPNYGEPVWSPEGRCLVYGVFDGANTTYTAYDLTTGEREILYVREAIQETLYAPVIEWSSDNTLVYVEDSHYFEVDLITHEIEYLLPDDIINFPL